MSARAIRAAIAARIAICALRLMDESFRSNRLQRADRDSHRVRAAAHLDDVRHVIAGARPRNGRVNRNIRLAFRTELLYTQPPPLVPALRGTWSPARFFRRTRTTRYTTNRNVDGQDDKLL